MTMKTVIITMLIGMGCFSANSQIPQPDPDTTAKHFLTVASIGNLQEISAGQLALQKARLSDVKSFAQMMIKDHGQAEQQLKDLAQQQHIDLPETATGGIKADIGLEKATAKFDKVYVHAMVSGHRSTVEMFENYATTGKNPSVKAFAQQMLPTLKAHLAAITDLDKQINSK
jgi:putative membrane protein